MVSSRVRRFAAISLGVGVGVLLASTTAAAQIGSGISGVVRDPSGGVLPGVVVEVASPSLIEGSRSSVTDSNGQYQIIDLRPGTYTVTFTLSGFQTVKRQAVELPTDFTSTINAELKVGALEEWSADKTAQDEQKGYLSDFFTNYFKVGSPEFEDIVTNGGVKAGPPRPNGTSTAGLRMSCQGPVRKSRIGRSVIHQSVPENRADWCRNSMSKP